MAKTDIKSAFRIIPVHPDDHPLLGMKWENFDDYDRCLVMGCSSSCAIFESFSTALEWIAIHRLGASNVLHILDDFLFSFSLTLKRCQLDLTNFLSMCQFLGVPIAEEKQSVPIPRYSLQALRLTLCCKRLGSQKMSFENVTHS